MRSPACSCWTASIAIAAAHGPVLGLQHQQIRKASGVLTKGYSVATQVSVRKHQSGVRGLWLHAAPDAVIHAAAVVGDTPLPPTRIQPGADFDSTLAWRFQHSATKVGTRFESTAFAGLAVPGPQSGFKESLTRQTCPAQCSARSPDGVAQPLRWLGSTFTKFYEHNGDKRPDVLDYSLGLRLSPTEMAQAAGQMGLAAVR